MSSTSSKNRDPLAPIEFITTVVVALMALILLAAGPFVALGGSAFGIGEREVCVTSTANGLEIAGSGPRVMNVVDGASGGVHGYDICSESHALALRLPYVVSMTTDFVFSMGAFGLLLLVLRAARRRGVFDRFVARRVRILGWFLVTGAWVFPLVKAIAEARMLALLTRHAGDGWVSYYSADLVVFVVGLGVVSMARVLDYTVPMRRELEATV